MSDNRTLGILCYFCGHYFSGFFVHAVEGRLSDLTNTTMVVLHIIVLAP